MTKKLLACGPLLVVVLFVVSPLLVQAQAKTVSGLIPCGNGPTTGGMVAENQRCDFNDLITLAQTVINFLIFKIAAPLAAIMFAYAGFLYVTNGGNEAKVKQAHDVFLYVLIGLVIALAAWLLVNFVLVFFLGSGSTYNFLTS